MAKNSPKTNDEALANNDKQVKKDSKKSGAQAQKKPNIFKRFARLCKEIVSELKKVTWPTGKETTKSTGIVIVVVLIFFLVLLGIDSGLTALYNLLVS